MKHLAWQIRAKLVETSDRASTPALGASLSCVDSMVAAYWGAMRIDPAKPHDPDRDRFLVGKSHAATLYAVLAFRGFFPIERLEEDAARADLPGIENASGSLGSGLSLGVGIARAGRIQKRSFRVFVQTNEDDCNEDSVRDAAKMASAEGLDNIVAIIDHQERPAIGQCNEILPLQPMKEPWESFGWSAHDVDGHDMAALVEVLGKVPDGSGKPIAVVAHTVAGKGLSYMDGQSNAPFPIPGADELGAA